MQDLLGPIMESWDGAKDQVINPEECGDNRMMIAPRRI